MKNALSKGSQCLCLAGAAAIAIQSHAFELGVDVGYMADYTNNTALTETDKVSEWTQTPSVSVTAFQDGPSLSASANYNISRQFHERDTFSDQTNSVGTALVTWRAIEDRLTFDLSNSSTLSTIDAQDANTPTNQQVVSTTTAGTTLTLPGFGNHLINLRYDYSLSDAHDTNTDDVRQTGTASYVIPLSITDRIQLNASTSDVNYDSSTSADYLSYSGDLQYVRGGDWIELDTRIGYTVFDRQQGAENADATTGDAKITWHASETTLAYASYARSLEDQSANLATGIPDFGQTITENTNVTTPYTLDTTTLGVTTSLGHNVIDLTGYVSEQRYESDTQSPATQPDEDTKGVTLGISRALRPTLAGSVYANYSENDFKDSSNQDNFDTGLRLDWTRWRNLTLFAGTTYTKRTSDVATEEYDAWTGFIGLTYALVGSGAGRARASGR